MQEPKVITIGDVIDSTVMHINKWNPKGTHTELKGNPVMRIKMTIIYYLSRLIIQFDCVSFEGRIWFRLLYAICNLHYVINQSDEDRNYYALSKLLLRLFR